MFSLWIARQFSNSQTLQLVRTQIVTPFFFARASAAPNAPVSSAVVAAWIGFPAAGIGTLLITLTPAAILSISPGANPCGVMLTSVVVLPGTTPLGLHLSGQKILLKPDPNASG